MGMSVCGIFFRCLWSNRCWYRCQDRPDLALLHLCRVYFPREREIQSQTQGELRFGERAQKYPEPSVSLLRRVPSPTLLTCIF